MNPNTSSIPASSAKMKSGNTRQTGSMMLESLIAILIFSMGIIAIVGMQASAVKASSDAKYRSDAGMLANQLVGQMWVSDRTPATMQTNFQGGGGVDGASYTAWLADVQTTLPGSAANPPVVTVNTATSVVTIRLNWVAPGELSTTLHSYNVVAQII